MTGHSFYRAVDQRGQVVDVRLRERRHLASAEALFRRAVKGGCWSRTRWLAIITSLM